MRTLAKSLTHLQNAVDRAYLEQHHGQLWKYAKMHHQYYGDAQLLVQEPREGGYILDFLTDNPVTKAVLDRVHQAINDAVEKSKHNGITEFKKIEDAISHRKAQISQGLLEPKELMTLIENPDPLMVRQYGDRAITREFDQVLALIRAKNSGDSTFELKITTDSGTKTHTFDRNKATKFHNVVTEKTLGEPIIYNGTLSSMDRHNQTAKVTNMNTKGISNLYFSNLLDFESTVTYFEQNTPFSFYGSPFIEYGAFDPKAGDIYFIGLV